MQQQFNTAKKAHNICAFWKNLVWNLLDVYFPLIIFVCSDLLLKFNCKDNLSIFQTSKIKMDPLIPFGFQWQLYSGL